MSSLRLRLIGGALRPFARLAFRHARNPAVERRRFERIARLAFRSPRGVTRREDPALARALWVSGPSALADRVVFHLHGGGYFAGSPRTHAHVAGHLSLAAGVAVFLPPYRLAPEHSPLDALEDIRAAWAYLRQLGFAPDRIALGGDSAGGGLALSLLAGLLAEGTRPGCVYLWSPFADQTFSGLSVAENAAADHFFPPERLHDLPAMILRGLDPADPRVSPLFADFPTPPPVLIQVSGSEILRDDAVRMAAKFRDAGGQVTLEVQPDAPHAWQLMHGWVPEAEEAVSRTGAFVAGALR